MAASKQIMTYFTGKLTVATPTAKKGDEPTNFDFLCCPKNILGKFMFFTQQGKQVQVGEVDVVILLISQKNVVEQVKQARHFDFFHQLLTPNN